MIASSFNKKALYIYKFLRGYKPIYAFYTILFLERGLSITQVAVLIALWSGFSIVFEIPAGILADRWNRRNILVMASLLHAVCFVLWFFAESFWMFAVGFLFWAISGALTSGTEEGLIYDNLKSDQSEAMFTKIYARGKFFGTVGTILAITSAGVLSRFISIEMIALLSAGVCLLNAIVAAFLRERNLYSEQLDANETGFFKTFTDAGVFMKNNPLAIIITLFLIMFASLGGYFDEFDALIINDFDMVLIWVSVILTVRFVFVALGDLAAPWIERRIKNTRQLFLLAALGCVSLLVFGWFWHIYFLLAFGLTAFLLEITSIVFVNKLQSVVKEEGRATVMSFFGVGSNLAMIVFGLIFAALAGMMPLQMVYIFISIYGIAGCLCFYIYAKLKNLC